MADSLGTFQSGSPNIADLISLVTDNMTHIYTLTGSANVNTSGTVSTTFDNSYQAFLVWYTFTYNQKYTASGFTVMKPGVLKFDASSYATISADKMTIYIYYGYWTTVTILGIL